MTPTRIRLARPDQLTILWQDGLTTCHPLERLRKACPCASCREESGQTADPFRVLKPAELEPLRLVKMEPVGHYAYKILWSDGHDTGIYSLEYLRGLEKPELIPIT